MLEFLSVFRRHLLVLSFGLYHSLPL
jgi:hypothetical protein